MLLRLNDDESAIDEVFDAFFANECSVDRVRGAEPLGHDAAAWRRLAETGAPGMCLPERAGGSGADLATAAVVANHLGRTVAPVPLVEHVAASRLLARLAPDHPALADLATGATIATLATRSVTGTSAPVVPAGAVAELVLACRGDDVVVRRGPPAPHLPNTADLPLASCDLGDAEVLLSGPGASDAFALGIAEWQALMSVALSGLGRRAVEIGVDYTKERYQFDVLIGTFQSLQHGLASAITRVEGAYFLANRAVWALDEGRDDGPRLAAMAFLFAAEAAQDAAATALQYHGGYGFSEEYDIQLFYRRAKGWALQYGEPAVEYQRLAAMTLPVAEVA